MPRTGRGLQVVDNVATMIKADSPYSCLRFDWKLLPVAHRVTACDSQLKAFYKIFPGHLFDLTRQLQFKQGCKNLRGR
jgi:hypothetical protein